MYITSLLVSDIVANIFVPGTQQDDEIGFEKLSCHVCRKTFSRKHNLRRHTELHFLKRKSYTCNICGCRFSWKTTLDTHVKSMHDVQINN